MQLELHCDRCHHDFVSALEDIAGRALEDITTEGPWFALGDGETLEDRLFANLTDPGKIACPDCGGPVSCSQESLGCLSQELLAQW